MPSHFRDFEADLRNPLRCTSLWTGAADAAKTPAIMNYRQAIIPAYLLLCLLLGGASAAGHWANMFLQLLAIPLIAWSVLAPQAGSAAPERTVLILAALVLLVPVVQLVPLPPGLWESLPGREAPAEVLRSLGGELSWMPASLTPYRTVASALWLLPAIAVVAAMLRVRAYRATWIAWIVIGAAVVSVIFGALQLTGGSEWYIYEITNYGATTGFFANSNHLATLLLATLPLIAALFTIYRRKRSSQRAGTLLALGGAAFVVTVGIIINGSLAGMGLALPVGAASLLLVRYTGKTPPRWTFPAIGIGTVSVIALAMFGPMGGNLVAEETVSRQSRQVIFSVAIEQADDYAPVGAGIGSFVEIYRMAEDPTSVTRFFVNHAHNDYIELWLDTGVLGLALMALVLLWWVRRSMAAWQSPDADPLARAATITIAAILAHSFVDYPLRTAAISALFAAMCVLVAAPRPANGESRTDPRGARHLVAE